MKYSYVFKREKNEISFNNLLIPELGIIVFGVLLGILSKLLDGPNFNPIFNDIGSNLGIWVFIASFLAVYSPSPKLAALKVFSFFSAFILAYYMYSFLILHIFFKRIIIIWGFATILSPMCAYIMWYAKCTGILPTFILAVPTTILFFECIQYMNAYKPFHTYFYLRYWFWGIYSVMICLLHVKISCNIKKSIFCFFISILMLSVLLIVLL